MAREIIPFADAPPQRTRFGVTVVKTYDGDPGNYEHRANMFRVGEPPLEEPARRVAGKVVAAIAGVFLLIGLASSNSGSDGAVLLVVISAIGLVCGLALLLHKETVNLPAVNPYVHDRMLAGARRTAGEMALERLGFDEKEDVRVQTAFLGAAYYPIQDVFASPTGFRLHPHHEVLTLHLGAQESGKPMIRFALYKMHHIYANETGLAYVHIAWDFIEQGRAAPRLVDMNRWVWRTIENLRVREDRFTIQTIGGNKFHLPYISDARTTFDDRTAADTYPSAAGPSPGVVAPGPGGPAGGWGSWDGPSAQAAAFWRDPARQQGVRQLLEDAREQALHFVNTVNSLRAEWEAAH